MCASFRFGFSSFLSPCPPTDCRFAPYLSAICMYLTLFALSALKHSINQLKVKQIVLKLKWYTSQAVQESDRLTTPSLVVFFSDSPCHFHSDKHLQRNHKFHLKRLPQVAVLLPNFLHCLLRPIDFRCGRKQVVFILYICREYIHFAEKIVMHRKGQPQKCVVNRLVELALSGYKIVAIKSIKCSVCRT